MQSMYREEILEIYEDRENFGEIPNKTHSAKLKNPICDDEIKIDVLLEDGIVKDVKFKGSTCFVSTFSSAAITRMIKGMTKEQVLNVTKKDVDDYIGQKVTPTRIKCQLLPLEAIKKALR